MKIIVAGNSKTGTKTMAVALRELGYNVYDFMEHYEYHAKEWDKIVSEGATKEDFRKMYADVDAVTDQPAVYFWDEIHAAFPESKIIFMMRKSEDEWWESFRRQVVSGDKLIFKLMRILSPSAARLHNWGRKMILAASGWHVTFFQWSTSNPNETLMRMWYRRHNAHVLQNAPKDKLLIYSVKDGWEPLCKFLGKSVPSSPFPHKNVRGNIFDEFLQKNPVVIRMQREALASTVVIVGLLLYGGYKTISSLH